MRHFSQASYDGVPRGSLFAQESVPHAFVSKQIEDNRPYHINSIRNTLHGLPWYDEFDLIEPLRESSVQQPSPSRQAGNNGIYRIHSKYNIQVECNLVNESSMLLSVEVLKSGRKVHWHPTVWKRTRESLGFKYIRSHTC